jgi:AcrR family transcriptional regulator
MATAITDVRQSTRFRILEATFDAVRDFGISRTTVEDVAHRAGFSRQTVYRYFPSKEHLILALVLREEEAFIEGTRRAFSSEDQLEAGFTGAITFCLRYAREHPLLDRLLAADQETFLPYLTTRGLPVIVRAREALMELVSERRPHIDGDTARGLLDAAIRATLSYIITPSERPPHEVARTMASALVSAIEDKESHVHESENAG